jgi:hypothetical protein
MSNLSDLIPAGGGQNNTDFVADGAIASGKPVILTAAGKAAEVAESARANTIGAEQTLNSGDNIQGANAWAYDATNDQYLWAYGDMDDSQNGWAHIVDISSGSVVEGTPVEFANWSVGDSSMTCIGSDKFLLIYKADIGGYMYGRVASVSGTTVTWGTEVTINSGVTAISNKVVQYSATTDASLLMYLPTGGGNPIYLRRITVSGTTITLGTATTINSILNNALGQDQTMQLGYNSTSDEFFPAWREENDGYDENGYAGIVTMSAGGTLAGTTAVTFSDQAKYSIAPVYCGDDKFAVFWMDDLQYNRYRVATISGGDVTWGTETVWESSTQTFNNSGAAYDESVNKIVVTTRPDGSPYHRTYTTGDLSGTTITFAALTALSPNTGLTSYDWLLYDPVLENTLFIYKNSSSDMVLRLWEVTGDISNLTASNLLGVASGAILDTATGTINTWGSRNEVQTSLTIASDYYVQTDGTITTTSTSPAQLLGKALSATMINIKDYTG